MFRLGNILYSIPPSFLFLNFIKLQALFLENLQGKTINVLICELFFFIPC
jgi:hypothetical protein